MTPIPVALETKTHYLVKTMGGATICTEYVHPGTHEPEIGALLQHTGGRFHGGPWRVVDYRRGAETSVLVVEPDSAP
jgi:hypothetical protein